MAPKRQPPAQGVAVRPRHYGERHAARAGVAPETENQVTAVDKRAKCHF